MGEGAQADLSSHSAYSISLAPSFPLSLSPLPSIPLTPPNEAALPTSPPRAGMGQEEGGGEVMEGGGGGHAAPPSPPPPPGSALPLPPALNPARPPKPRLGSGGLPPKERALVRLFAAACHRRWGELGGELREREERRGEERKGAPAEEEGAVGCTAKTVALTLSPFFLALLSLSRRPRRRLRHSGGHPGRGPGDRAPPGGGGRVRALPGRDERAGGGRGERDVEKKREARARARARARPFPRGERPAPSHLLTFFFSLPTSSSWDRPRPASSRGRPPRGGLAAAAESTPPQPPPRLSTIRPPPRSPASTAGPPRP